jgi:hypothetical protein
MTEQGFQIVIASPPDYENLVAEIYYEDKFVVLVSQERALGAFDIETRMTDVQEDQVTRRVELQGFIEAVNRACAKLRGDV